MSPNRHDAAAHQHVVCLSINKNAVEGEETDSIHRLGVGVSKDPRIRHAHERYL
ncbi:hypothetical protein CY34DRAFT_809974 [Suillus luteus UH-Slu-Lm8-n1]|uniref:Uncharacterized protein n=1 Tax=Suillus luteus UH-Slu-Lm8-n1 TaxID=930992 RepID=A0A0D0AI75_9AGAM|nr:hypothetical protein CY34DRAFT_809974 [Suillus luteus UH-Slu-Lm8-n1]